MTRSMRAISAMFASVLLGVSTMAKAQSIPLVEVHGHVERVNEQLADFVVTEIFPFMSDGRKAERVARERFSCPGVPTSGRRVPTSTMALGDRIPLEWVEEAPPPLMHIPGLSRRWTYVRLRVPANRWDRVCGRHVVQLSVVLLNGGRRSQELVLRGARNGPLDELLQRGRLLWWPGSRARETKRPYIGMRLSWDPEFANSATASSLRELD